jgi:hypothetical protein
MFGIVLKHLGGKCDAMGLYFLFKPPTKNLKLWAWYVKETKEVGRFLKSWFIS